MIKVTSLTKDELSAAGALIGESFYDYPYGEGEGGLKALAPTRDAMNKYMQAFIKIGLACGTLYTTSEQHEGYIMFSGTYEKSPDVKTIINMFKDYKDALGGIQPLMAFLKAATSGGTSLEAQMKMDKVPFLKVEMLIVGKEYQKQGYMRQMMAFAIKKAEEQNAVLILDTDAKGKCDRYCHLGMSLYGKRQTAGFTIYDLLYETDHFKMKDLRHPNYKNWVPKGMVRAFDVATLGLTVGNVAAYKLTKYAPKPLQLGICSLMGLLLIGTGAMTLWCHYAYHQFSYDGKRHLSKDIIEGIVAQIEMEAGSAGLDVGCGSGALTIAVAKKFPEIAMTGIDYWGKEYASFSKELCERNAVAEGVDQITFKQGDARHLDFKDETFDLVTSNYVYHNIAGSNKQALLKETLRVLKKGGVFAIHDIMTPVRYGDMQKFVDELIAEGYEKVELIPTTEGLFMDKAEAFTLELTGSMLLIGKK